MQTNRTFAEDASAPTLAEHDRRFHPNGFDPSKDRCKLREKMAKADEADDLTKKIPIQGRLAESRMRIQKDTSGCDADGFLRTKLPDGIDPKTEDAREAAYKQAQENVDLLMRCVKEAADAAEGDALFRGENKAGDGVDPREVGYRVKKRKRVDEKAKDDYNGDYSRVTDLIGGTISLGADGDMGKALESLRKSLPDGASIAQVKPLSSPEDGGYWDVKASIRFPNGGLGEVILVDSDVLEAKNNRGGHNLYDFQRTIAPVATKNGGLYKELAAALHDLEIGIYAHRKPLAEKYQGDSWERAKATASSSLTRLQGVGQSLISSDVMGRLKDLLSGSHLHQPASLTSKAKPASSLMKKGISKSPSSRSLSKGSHGVNPEVEWPLLPGLKAEDSWEWEDREKNEILLGSDFDWDDEDEEEEEEEEDYAEDALKLGAKPTVANTPVVQSLMDHDARFHPNGFKEGTKCKFREERGIKGVGYNPSKAQSGGGSSPGGSQPPTSPAPTENDPAAAQAGQQAVAKAIADIRRDFPNDPSAEEAIAAIEAGLEVDLALADVGLTRTPSAPEAPAAEAPAAETPAPEAEAPAEQPAEASEEQPAEPAKALLPTSEEEKANDYTPDPDNKEEVALAKSLREGLDAAGLDDVAITGSIDSPSFINFKLDLPLNKKSKELRKAFEIINRATGFSGEDGPSVELSWDGSTPVLTFPKKEKEDVPLAEALASDEYEKAVKASPQGVVVPFCRDNLGRLQCVDILKAPHMLVTGTTGSGKSAFLNSLLTSIAKTYKGKVRVGIIDGKGNEFAPFNNISKGLLAHDTVHADSKETLYYAKKLVEKMEERNSIFERAIRYLQKNGFPGAAISNIGAYNSLPADQRRVLDQARDENGNKMFPDKMEPIVEIFDEYKDIRDSMNKESLAEFDNAIGRLLQMGRAAGISCIVTTQSPYATAVPGTQKSNLPLKVTFKTTKNLPDSAPGKDLSGKGDMRFGTGENFTRGQSTYIPDSEIRAQIPDAYDPDPDAAPSASPAPAPASPASTGSSQSTETNPPPAPSPSPAPQPANASANIQQAISSLQHLAGNNPVIARVVSMLEQASQTAIASSGGLGSYAQPMPPPLPRTAFANPAPAPAPTKAERVAANYPRTSDGRIDLSNLGFWKRIGAAFRLGQAGVGNNAIKFGPDPGEVREKMKSVTLPPDANNHALAKKYGQIPDTVSDFDRDMLAAAIKAYDRAVSAGRPEQARKAAAEYQMLVGGGKREEEDAPNPLYV